MKPCFIISLFALAAMVGCRTVPTPAERVERERLENVGRDFLPESRPVLPALDADSAPADYLRWAILNQPSVTAAYFEWAAAVSRIPAARTPPDPRLTFQADIQSVVTSLMPGLMFDFPGPGKLAAGAEVASAESEMKYHAFTRAALQAAFEVKKACWELRTLDARLELNRQMAGLLAELKGAGAIAQGGGEAVAVVIERV